MRLGLLFFCGNEGAEMNSKEMKFKTVLTRYMIPQMVGLVINSTYFIVDGIFVGRRLGTDALAAVGVSVPIVEVMIAISMLIAAGSGVMIASSYGKGMHQFARDIFNLSVMIAVIFSFFVVAAGNIFLMPLSHLLGANDVILEDTMTYLRYFITFSPFLVFSFLFSTHARNDGRPKLAMWALVIGSGCNILLDYIFMYPFNMGIAGAGLATGLGSLFSALILLPHYLSKRGNLYFEIPILKKESIYRILVNGTPAFISEFSIGLVTLLYNLAIVHNGLGEKGLAAYVIIGYASLICLSVFIGASQGIQPVIGYFSGAEESLKIKELFKKSTILLILLGSILYFILMIGGESFFQIFVKEDQALLAYTGGIMALYFINLPFAAVNILVISILQSMEQIKASLLIAVFRSSLAVMLFLIVLPVFLGENGVWVAATFGEIVTLLIILRIWQKRDRKERVIR